MEHIQHSIISQKSYFLFLCKSTFILIQRVGVIAQTFEDEIGGKCLTHLTKTSLVWCSYIETDTLSYNKSAKFQPQQKLAH